MSLLNLQAGDDLIMATITMTTTTSIKNDNCVILINNSKNEDDLYFNFVI